METLSVRGAARETEVAPDSSWRSLYRAGAVSAALFLLLVIVSLVLEFTTSQSPMSGGADTLQYIAAHRSLYMLKQILWLALSAFAIVVFLALYMALKHLNKSYAIIGSLAGIVSWALTLAVPVTGGGSPVLVSLSDQYMAVTTDAQRAAFAAAAEAFIAENNTVNAPGVLTPVGILIVSLVMLKGTFPKSIAYLGILTGVAGIICEALRPVLGIGYIVYGLLLPIWFAAVGWKLYRFSQG